MELENRAVKETYIKLLADTFIKKSKVLGELLVLTKAQETLIATDDFDEEQFLELISKKEEEIQILNQLDEGFERLYDRVRDEIFESKEKYQAEIMQLKELIVRVTDTSVQLQVIEKRNKVRLETYFSNRRRDIKSSRMSNKTVASYYKTMSQGQDTPSFFYDKKN